MAGHDCSYVQAGHGPHVVCSGLSFGLDCQAAASLIAAPACLPVIWWLGSSVPGNLSSHQPSGAVSTDKLGLARAVMGLKSKFIYLCTSPLHREKS